MNKHSQAFILLDFLTLMRLCIKAFSNVNDVIFIFKMNRCPHPVHVDCVDSLPENEFSQPGAIFFFSVSTVFLVWRFVFSSS